MTCSRSAHWSLPDQSRVSSVAAGIVAVALLSRSSSHTTMERKNGSIKLLLAPMIPDSSIQMLNTAGMRRHAVPKGNKALIEVGARAHMVCSGAAAAIDLVPARTLPSQIGQAL